MGETQADKFYLRALIKGTVKRITISEKEYRSIRNSIPAYEPREVWSKLVCQAEEEIAKAYPLRDRIVGRTKYAMHCLGHPVLHFTSGLAEVGSGIPYSEIEHLSVESFIEEEAKRRSTQRIQREKAENDPGSIIESEEW